jgi:hypothetical protein
MSFVATHSEYFISLGNVTTAASHALSLLLWLPVLCVELVGSTRMRNASS